MPAATYRRFKKLLTANRGEIACRIIRTARAMGLSTVAVYSEADAGARHVSDADEAVLLGPARARDSYLNIERLIAAARETGAEAIHPGYGFLSESAAFASACAAAGLIFVGPTADMIEAMGSKSGAKALMEKAGVPLVPGGVAPEEVDIVINSHLHFDHCGWNTVRKGDKLFHFPQSEVLRAGRRVEARA